MLERISDIRASERRIYLRAHKIFTLTADYQSSLKEVSLFFQTIPNKLHFACTDHDSWFSVLIGHIWGQEKRYIKAI